MASLCHYPIHFVSSFIFKFGNPSEKGLSFPNWSFQPPKAMFENRKSERNTIVFRDLRMPTNSPQVRESGNILHVESGILGFGTQNTAQRIRNPSSDWNPESKFHLQRLESSTWNTEFVALNLESKTVLDSLTCGETNPSEV